MSCFSTTIQNSHKFYVYIPLPVTGLNQLLEAVLTGLYRTGQLFTQTQAGPDDVTVHLRPLLQDSFRQTAGAE